MRFRLAEREHRKALRTLAYTAVVLALLVFVWVTSARVAADALPALLKLALGIVGLAVLLNQVNDIARTLRIDTPLGSMETGEERWS